MISLLVGREPHNVTYDFEDEVVGGWVVSVVGALGEDICLVNSLAPSVSALKRKQWVKTMEETHLVVG